MLTLDKYRDYDDYEYKGIKNIKDLFKTSINKDHYKPNKTKIIITTLNMKVEEIEYYQFENI